MNQEIKGVKKMREILEKETAEVYKIMKKNYPILHTLFTECEQQIIVTEHTRFGDNYCQIVRVPYKVNLTEKAIMFLEKLQTMFLKNDKKAKLENNKTYKTYTKRIPSKDLDFLKKNCILVSCGNDNIGQRKLRVIDWEDEFCIFSDVAVCTKDEWKEFKLLEKLQKERYKEIA